MSKNIDSTLQLIDTYSGILNFLYIGINTYKIKGLLQEAFETPNHKILI